MIFIGNFFHATNQQEIEEPERRHGEFSMIVQAPSSAVAIEMFRSRILNYRKTSDFFEGESSIFLAQLLEFEEFPDTQAMMINYKSMAGDPVMPFIGCTVPSHEADACRIFDWKNNAPEIDGQNERLFLKFNA